MASRHDLVYEGREGRAVVGLKSGAPGSERTSGPQKGMAYEHMRQLNEP